MDRGKLGSKRHIVVDERGIPLAVTITGANRHDSKAFESTLDAIPAVPGLNGPARRQLDRQLGPRERYQSCELVVSYAFYAFMFVPAGGVNIV